MTYGPAASAASAASAAASPEPDAATSGEPTLDPRDQATLAAIAGHLLPAGHGMPSAAEVVTDDRLQFVLASRPDLREPLRIALRAELGADPATCLAALARDEPAALAVLQLVIVAAYYTDRRVRELIGYQGQEAIEVKSWLYPAYMEEGLVDAVMARGPVWRDPDTGRRAVVDGAPRSYAERASGAEPGAPPTATPEGGSDGRHEVA